MEVQGSIGYKIGRKLRLMRVQCDADLLWQMCVREIYVLIKHYGSLDAIKQIFENLKDARNKPKKETIDKCKPFTDLTNTVTDWSNLLKNCQHSFINIIETGYFLNNGQDDYGLTFIIDFNKGETIFYSKDTHKKTIEHKKASIDEIMLFEEMPTLSLTEIITTHKERFYKYFSNLEKIREEKEKINDIIHKAFELGADQNIIKKANKLLEDLDWEEVKLDKDYRVFYYRLDALNLIDHTKS